MKTSWSILAAISLALLIKCSSNDPTPAADPRDTWVGTWKGSGTFVSSYPACYTSLAFGNPSPYTGSANFEVKIVASTSNSTQLNLSISSNPTSAVYFTGYQATNLQTTGSVTTGIFEEFDLAADRTWKFETPSFIGSDGKLNFNGEVLQSSFCQPGNVQILLNHVFFATLTKQ